MVESLRETLFSVPKDEAEAHARKFVAAYEGDEAELRELLFGAPADPFKPSALRAVARDSHYHLISAMGASGDARFIPVLCDALQNHPHHCPQFAVVKALTRLGAPPGDDWKLAIDAWTHDGRILIGTDDKYQGSSDCPECRFFPCRISRYDAGVVGRCKLWNRTDPDTLGEIEDVRTWGDHVERAPPERRHDNTGMLAVAGALLDSNDALAALPVLCLVIASEERQACPQGWWLLGRGFEMLGEPAAATVCWLEALNLKNLVPLALTEVHAWLAEFAARREAAIQRFVDRSQPPPRPVPNESLGRWVLAWDAAVLENLRDEGVAASTWYSIGRAHGRLHEFALAELMLRHAMLRNGENGDLHQLRLFAETLAEVQAQSSREPDSGLAVDRRKQERSRPRLRGASSRC